jgi:lipopolysaccharide exporter
MSGDNFRSKLTAGVVWMVTFKFLEKGLGLLSTLILARILAPSDFGIVAMSMSFVAFLELCTSFGFDIALIQKQHATRDAYDTAWTFNVMLGVGVAVLLVALSWPAGQFYRHPEVMGVMCVLAVGSLAQGLENVGVVAFRKELRFDREFRFLLTKKLIVFAITVPLAYFTRSYWALVVGIVTGRIGGVALSYLLHPYRPRFSLRAFRELADFSKWLVAVNFLHFLKERSADFVIGRFQGARAVGLFSVSYELASIPATELVAPINRAVYPAYASIAHDRPRLREEYLVVLAMISFLAVPAVAGMAATSTLLVPVVLGSQWVAAAPVLAVLAFFGLTQIMLSNAHAVYLAVGKPQIGANLSVVHVTALILGLLAMTGTKGLMGAAAAYLIVAVIMMPLNFYVIMRVLDIRLGALLARTWRPLVAATAMYWIVRAGFIGDTQVQGTSAGAVATLLVAVLAGAVSYCVGIVLLWLACKRPEGPEAVFLRRVMSTLRLRAAI